MSGPQVPQLSLCVPVWHAVDRVYHPPVSGDLLTWYHVWKHKCETNCNVFVSQQRISWANFVMFCGFLLSWFSSLPFRCLLPYRMFLRGAPAIAIHLLTQCLEGKALGIKCQGNSFQDSEITRCITNHHKLAIGRKTWTKIDTQERKKWTLTNTTPFHHTTVFVAPNDSKSDKSYVGLPVLHPKPISSETPGELGRQLIPLGSKFSRSSFSLLFTNLWCLCLTSYLSFCCVVIFLNLFFLRALKRVDSLPLQLHWQKARHNLGQEC